MLVTFDDVSDRLAIARMRADFVANASHELRTPLASLTGFIETLLGPARNDPVASEKFLHVMLDQARRMRRLIDDLLSLSRVEMRAHTRPTDRVDLVGVLRHVADAMQPLAAEHSVVLSIDAPPGPIEMVGERDELVQLVQNLVENAIRYGASGGKVDVSLELRPAGRLRAVIRVRDYGPGIAPEHVPRLTERFYRVDAGASREMKGTGLGLAIVKHILTRHGGQLDVASTPGSGSTFTVELPLPPISTAVGEENYVKSNA
jgi:two-component system phosphate regulon sensor histidine kinase PhoR